MDFHSLKHDQTPLVHLHIFLLHIFSHFHIIWLCQCLSRNIWIPWNFWILVNILLVHLKRACEVAIFIFLKTNKEFWLEKMSIIRNIWNFHLGSAKPSWNFNSAYRVEIFTCNCNVILKRCLLFSRDEISTRFNELKFQSGLKIFI